VSLAALRVVIVLIFLWHGAPKAFKPGAAMEKFAGMGLPPILGPITGWAEVIASAALLLGAGTPWASAVLAVIMVGAIGTVQAAKGIQPGLERDVLILAGTLVLAAFGPGCCSIDERASGTDAEAGAAS